LFQNLQPFTNGDEVSAFLSTDYFLIHHEQVIKMNAEGLKGLLEQRLPVKFPLFDYEVFSFRMKELYHVVTMPFRSIRMKEEYHSFFV
jgi:hypothetical protein